MQVIASSRLIQLFRLEEEPWEKIKPQAGISIFTAHCALYVDILQNIVQPAHTPSLSGAASQNA